MDIDAKPLSHNEQKIAKKRAGGSASNHSDTRVVVELEVISGGFALGK